MKVKYFIRGLGIGILITAIILGISYKSKDSDEDVILRAKKLGMVFAEDVSGSALEFDEMQTSEPVVKDEAAATPEPADEPTADNTDEPEKEPADKHADEAKDKPAEKETSKPSNKSDKSDNKSDKKITDEKVKFSIKGGELASSVSKQLEKLGIIKDAKEFNRYLSDNGYSVRIRVGEYTAEKGMSYEDIAKMISR